MPFSLEVYVDDEAVVVSLEDGDTISSLACVLEEQGFQINVAFPDLYVGHRRVEDTFIAVDTSLTYKFCKLSM